MTSTPSLHIARIAFASLWRVWHLRREIALAMLLPAAAIAALTYFLLQSTAPANAPVRWTAYFARVIVLAFAAVSCHRLILLGSGSVPRLGVTGWGRRERIFLLLVAAVSVIAMLSSMIVGAITSVVASIPVNLLDRSLDKVAITVVTTAAALGGAYAFARVSLVLPARAVDEPMSFPEALALTKPHALRLFVLIALLPWGMSWIEHLLAASFESPSAYWTVSTTIYLLLLPLEIALLSESYRALKVARSNDPL